MYKTIGSANEELTQNRDKAWRLWTECREQSSLSALFTDAFISAMISDQHRCAVTGKEKPESGFS